MKKILRQGKQIRGGYGRNSPYNIIPYLPNEDCFFDSRHLTYGLTSEELPFSVTTKISSNNQQFLKVYETNKEDTDNQRSAPLQ
jgi:hypothetical protein